MRAPAFLPLGVVQEEEASEWDADLPVFPTLAEAVAATGAEAAVIDGPPAGRAERVVEALALDLHVLVEAPLGSPEEVQRVVVIAQNRGLRLMLRDPQRYPTPEAAATAFARYVLEGAEPPTGGRRLLG